MAKLTAKARAEIPKKDFAVPGKGDGGGYPIDTKARAKAALGLVGMHGSPGEKAQVRSAVAKKYPDIDQSKGPQAKRTGNGNGQGNGNGRGNGQGNGRNGGSTTQRLSQRLDDRLDAKTRSRQH